MIYKEDYNLNQAFDNTILKRYGGFLKLAPQNTPIQVKARIYIIKGILNPIRDNSLCDPYISIQLGEKVIEDSENVRQNTTEPTFGWFLDFC